jgi:hypothetical protein
MSLILDDEKIAAVAQILELAGKIGDGVYQTISDALKQNHPELVPADIPGEESAAMHAKAEQLIDAKFPDTERPKPSQR